MESIQTIIEEKKRKYYIMNINSNRTIFDNLTQGL